MDGPLWRRGRRRLRGQEKSFEGVPGFFAPEGLAVLGVEVNGPQPFGLPVRAQAADVDREVVETVAARGGIGLVDQRDGHAVVGVDAPAVLAEGVA
jgi:hypothetical protein